MSFTRGTASWIRGAFIAALLFGLAALQGFAADTYRITVFAGTGDRGFSGDGGPAIGATFSPLGNLQLCIDASGNFYFTDSGNNRIRKIDASGIITTVAGNGTKGYSGDGGPATEASLNWPISCWVDAAGNLYIADYYNDRFRKVDAAGTITTLLKGTAPEPINPEYANGPCEVYVDEAQNIYLQWALGGWQKIDKSGNMTNYSGSTAPYPGLIDKSRNIYFGENNTIYKMDAAGKKIAVAGNGSVGYSGDGGPAIKASFGEYITGVDVDEAGNLYICDYSNRRIRKVDTSGIITTIAGGGYLSARSSEGGLATKAALMGPGVIKVDRAGNLYFFDGDGASSVYIRKLYRP